MQHLINQIESIYGLPTGSISTKQNRTGRPNKINGKDISMYRAAIVKQLRLRGMLMKDIAPIVGVSDHTCVSDLARLAEAYDFNKNTDWLKIHVDISNLLAV
jgi:hypothetical protein